MKRTLLRAACVLLGMFPFLTQAALTGTFTITPTSGNAPLTATLTWNVTGGTAATTCTATGGWTGTKPLSGTHTTPALLNDASYTLSCTTPAVPGTAPGTGSVTLSWTAPTENTDGTPLTTLAGYNISYGQAATALNQTINISNATARSYVVSGLSGGTWYFTVRAFTTTGAESANSNIASKDLGIMDPGSPGIPIQQWSKTVSIDVNAQPQAPVLTVAALEVYRPNTGYKGQLKVDRIGQFTVLGQICVPGQSMNGFNVVKISTPTSLIKLDPGKAWPMQILARCTAS